MVNSTYDRSNSHPAARKSVRVGLCDRAEEGYLPTILRSAQFRGICLPRDTHNLELQPGLASVSGGGMWTNIPPAN